VVCGMQTAPAAPAWSYRLGMGLAIMLILPCAMAQHHVDVNGTRTVATYTEVDARVCRALASPVIEITEAARLGRLSILNDQAPQAVRGCGTLMVPRTQIVYQALSRPGTDRLAWQVRYQATARNRSDGATIIVSQDSDPAGRRTEARVPPPDGATRRQ